MEENPTLDENSLPSTSAPPEPIPEHKEHTEEPKRPARRRSSLGIKIMSSFISSGSEDVMSPVQKRVQPKRMAQLKIAPLPLVQPPPPPRTRACQRPIRYSFDVGERVAVKPCLKSATKTPIRVRPADGAMIPPRKSLTQQAAQRVMQKYRRSMSKTPQKRGTSGKLKFNKICSIRVITPRPNYNPNDLVMPHSDDEEDTMNPNRERLSTVKLRLTPTSQAKLEQMQSEDVFQFNAEMVFGDGGGGSAPSTSSIASYSAESVTETALESVNTKSVESKTRPSSRRKSLILGAASPLKSPAKIEKPRLEEPEQKSKRSRRSLRLNPDAIEPPVKSCDLLEDEREESSSKKRENHDPGYDLEPLAKRGPLKSEIHSFFAPRSAKKPVVSLDGEADSVEVNCVEMAVESEKKQRKNRRYSAYFGSAEKEVESISKPLEAEKKRSRRSSAYSGNSVESKSLESKSLDKEVEPKVRTARKSMAAKSVEPKTLEKDAEPSRKSESPEKTVEPPAKSSEEIKEEKKKLKIRRSSAYFRVAKPLPTSDDAAPETEEEIVVISSPEAPENGKLATIFSKSTPVVGNKKMLELKKAETKSTPPTSQKPSSSGPVFSIFSPKPVKPAVTPKVTTLSDSPMGSVSGPPSSSFSKKSNGVRRKEHWGDLCAETYQFFEKIPILPAIFEEFAEIDDGKIFKSRSFDPKILDSTGIVSELQEDLLELHKPYERSRELTMAQNPPDSSLEKLEVPQNSCTTTIYPSTMDSLVEGAEEEPTVRGWLRRWKRRVRKAMEREIAEQQGKKKKRKRRDEDHESDEDYEVEHQDDDLENPLVLIGPSGVGKTALFRALAKQENMRIISIGPETGRSGSEIKRNLQEALRSHRVDQQPHPTRTIPFYKTIPRETPAPPPQLAPKDFVQSLVVFEHVDVFFETLDRHGILGLLEAVNEAAVPVVFTCEQEWPRRWGQVELRRPHLEICLNRNQCRVQKYVQNLVYSCRNVIIDDATIKQLSESVNHDLSALLHQAHLFSLAPHRPFPLTTRHLVSTGFSEHWEKPRCSLTKTQERMEELFEQYADVLPDGAVALSRSPGVEKLWDTDRQKLAESQAGYSEGVRNAYEALNGRFSRRDLVQDVLPMLVPMDRVERQKRVRSRRHLHRFKQYSKDFPMDGDQLINVVGGWSMSL